MIVDSSLFLFADPNTIKNYLRYGYDGIFPNTAEYCWDNPDPNALGKDKKDPKNRFATMETWWWSICINMLSTRWWMEYERNKSIGLVANGCARSEKSVAQKINQS